MVFVFEWFDVGDFGWIMLFVKCVVVGVVIVCSVLFGFLLGVLLLSEFELEVVCVDCLLWEIGGVLLMIEMIVLYVFFVVLFGVGYIGIVFVKVLVMLLC